MRWVRHARGYNPWHAMPASDPRPGHMCPGQRGPDFGTQPRPGQLMLCYRHPTQPHNGVTCSISGAPWPPSFMTIHYNLAREPSESGVFGFHLSGQYRGEGALGQATLTSPSGGGGTCRVWDPCPFRALWYRVIWSKYLGDRGEGALGQATLTSTGGG